MGNSTKATKQAKGTKLIESRVENGSRVVFTNGTETEAVDVAAFAGDLLLQAAVHGTKQKIGDSAAKSRDPETGKPAPLADRWAAIVAMAARLRSGHWNDPERGQGDGTSGSIVVSALMRLSGKPRSEVDAEIDAMTTDDVSRRDVLAAMRRNPKVADMIRVIEAERATVAPAVAANVDDMVSRLIGGGGA